MRLVNVMTVNNNLINKVRAKVRCKDSENIVMPLTIAVSTLGVIADVVIVKEFINILKVLQ